MEIHSRLEYGSKEESRFKLKLTIALKQIKIKLIAEKKITRNQQ